MKNLLLTLGHNSSAILIEDEKVVWGYETERLSGRKSDSRFPMPFVDKLVGEVKPDMVYVTHWAPDCVLSSMGQKYWDPSRFDGVPIRTLSLECTHHDTHMLAALCYAGPQFPKYKSYGFVVDGFGTLGEHFSVYDLSSGQPELVRRVHGYDTSLGLWYQYATAFMGMKMHEDEYKLLGYEVHVSDSDAELLDVDAAVTAADWVDRMSKSVYGSMYDPMYSVDALPAVKDRIFSHLLQVCKKYGIEDPTTFESRCLLAYYVQQVLERVVLYHVVETGADNVVLSGGCFYNVKLNKRIVDMTDGLVCVYPLAGDQGNALGLYSLDHPEFEFPPNLNWGRRTLRDVGQVNGLTYVSQEKALGHLMDAILEHGHVNLVRGDMEFGPRALCNTSTLAMPTMENVRKINAANERNTVMPMAPVVSPSMYASMFERAGRVWKSCFHMVCAMEFKEHPSDDMLGVSHRYKRPYFHHTARPQIASGADSLLTDLLRHFKTPLINTSFNFHGKPIAFDMPSVIENHMDQHSRDNSFTTVVVKS